MAIQMRRGANANFDKSKMLPGEFAVTTDGTRKVYAAFASNDVKELASKDDVQGLINNFSQVVDKEIADAEQRIESKGQQVLDAIPDIYEEVSQKADEAVRTKADAIVCTASGSNIVVNDSSNDYLRNLKLFGKTEQSTTSGKQLLDIDTAKINYINPGTGVEEANDSWKNTPSISCKANATYTFSMKTKDFFQMTVAFYDANKNFISGDSKADYNITQYTFTTPNNASFMRVAYSFKLSSGEVARDDIMLNEGTEPLPWEKFTGLQPSPNPNYPQKLDSKGKWGNLLENTAETQTINGGTVTINKDKSITFNGTFTSITHIYINRNVSLEEGKKYILSGCPSGGGETTHKMYLMTETFENIVMDYGDKATFTHIPNRCVILVTVSKGTYNNLTFYPMISESNISYRPYSGQKEIESGVLNKNYLEVRDNTGTSNGTSVNNRTENGSVIVNGTATQNTAFWINTFTAKKDEDIIMNGIAGGSASTYQLRLYDDTGSTVLLRINEGDSTPFHVTKGTTYRVYVFIFSGATVNNVTLYPMIRPASITDGTYEPYTKQSHISLVSDGLKGIPVTDSSLATYTDENGQMWCADYVDCDRGVLVQRIGVVTHDMWSLSNVSDTTSGHRFVANLTKPMNATRLIPVICSHYIQQNNSGYSTKGDYITTNEAGYIHIRTLEKDFATIEEFKAWTTEENMLVYYILATPIETPLSATELESYKALHSNYGVTSVMNDCEAFSELKYNADTKLYIDNKFAELAAKLTNLS